jgi:hypothetical protein
MAKLLEHVEGGWRFNWAGGSFVLVRLVIESTTLAPYDLMTLPEWVTVSHFEQETLIALAKLWFWRNEQASKPLISTY